MKKLIIIIAAATIFVSCKSNNKNKADTTEKQRVGVVDGVAYHVDSTSTISWAGSKPMGKHTGIFKIKEGVLQVKDNTLTGGNFVIDINSLNNEDLAADAENKSKLEGHLKSPDFFNVAKYPTASFQITAIAANTDSTQKGITHIIKGNLTLKDSTKNISFPARVTIDDKTVAASADFSIDRTQWGISYKGPNNPQDWVISKTVSIKLNIVAAKK